MATSEKQKLQYTYRAAIHLNDVELDPISFLGLTEIYEFMSNIYPLKVLMINLSLLDLRSKYFLDSNNREVKIMMSLFRVESSTLPKTDPDYTYTEYNVFTDKEFYGTVDEEFIPLTDNEIRNINENEKAEKIDMLHMVRIYLKELVPNPFVENVFNVVTDGNTSISDLVCAAFMKCASTDLKLSIDVPSNTNNIPENTLIPPMGFIQTLDYFQDNYGLYSYGFSIFIKDYTCYIINKEGVRNKNEANFIIKVIPTTAANVMTLGYIETNKDNIIYTDSTALHITDVHSEYYSNRSSKIDEDGEMYHPDNLDKNISLFVDEELVQSVYNPGNQKNKLQDFSVILQNTYIDITPDMMFQIETNDLVFEKLAVWGYQRVVSPAGCITNMNLFRRT